ncbi:MAG: hypothetical protein AB1485_03040 [Candidatus Thermoplasmatota archaeon]
MSKRGLSVYLNLAAKMLFIVSAIILATGFILLLIALPAIRAGNWENVVFISRKMYWKIIVAGLLIMLFGMVFYITAFLRGKK